MKKKAQSISSPDELNKNLSYSSPATWITLLSVVAMLIGFLVWSFVFKIQVKVTGTASVANHQATLALREKDLGKVKADSMVVIQGKDYPIASFNEDNQPVVTGINLSDADYEFYIVVDELKPIDFWFRNK